MAQVERDVDLRADGVAEDDDPVGEASPAPAAAGSPDSVAAVVAEDERTPARRRRRPRRGRAPATSPARRPVTLRHHPAPGAAELVPVEEGAEHVGRLARREQRPDRGRAASARRSSASSRSSLARRRAATSFFVRRTCVIRPLRGSRSGTTIPLTSGKLCSQTGSWITTGTTSQRCSTAVSQVSREGGSRKSEKTKTKLPAVTLRRCSKRCSSERSTPSAGAPQPRRRRAAPRAGSASRRSPRGGSQNGSPSA